MIESQHVDKLVDQFVRAQGTIGIKAGSKHALSGGIISTESYVGVADVQS